MAKERADRLLVASGLAPSRERARALILAGKVRHEGQRVDKAGDMVPADAVLSVEGNPIPFVSRGGVKLKAALDRFCIVPDGRRCLDAGASTGGFTDCLLQQGAAHVVAVDVGSGQLDWTLQQDSRVTRLDRTNARSLTPEQVGEAPSLVVADLSFISLTKVLPALVSCAPQAEFVVLVKPQFEAGRDRVGRGGVVRDPGTWLQCMRAVTSCFEELGFSLRGACASPLIGPAGNVEFLLHAVPVPRGGTAEPPHSVPLLLGSAAEEGKALTSAPEET